MPSASPATCPQTPAAGARGEIDVCGRHRLRRTSTPACPLIASAKWCSNHDTNLAQALSSSTNGGAAPSWTKIESLGHQR